jgi:hypothetical protein
LLLLYFVLRQFGRREFSWGKISDVAIIERSSVTFGSLRSWFLKHFREQAGKIFSRLNVLDRSGFLGAVRIRRIYAQLMQLCDRLDMPRPSTATPLEYLEQLELLFPEKRSEVRTVTHAYNRVRYGEFPETPEEVQKVENAWRQVRQRARDLQSVRKHLSGEKNR